MHPRIHTLKNGLRVIFVDTKAFPSITTLLLVGAGSRYETVHNNGVAHFLEHMFFKGSKHYPTPYDVSSAIEGLGGAWNAFTSKDYTGYYIKATTDHFDKVISILSDILLYPLLDEKEIQKEKGVITEEINMYEDMPQVRVGEIFENLLYADSPLGFDVIGKKSTIQSFSKESFTRYIDSLYHPSNSVLVIAGGLGEKKNYVQEVEKVFGNWTDAATLAFTKQYEAQTEPKVSVYEKKTEQAHFCLGFRTFSFSDPRKYTLTVLSALLGGGASSKLFIEVREKKGLCYYISTGRQHYADCGNVVTQAGVPKDIDKLKLAIRATLQEHKKIAKGTFERNDLVRAKEIIKGHFYLSMEDSYNVASHYGKKMLLERTDISPKEQIRLIEKVTMDDITALAAEIFVPNGLNLSVVGPFTQDSLSASDLL